MSKISGVSFCGAVLLLSSLAFPATVIKTEGGDVGGPVKEKGAIYIDNGKIRMELSAASGNILIICDVDKQVFWMIPGNGTYMEMTPASMEAMSQQMAGMMKQRQDAMANMPPEQRARMEEMMKGRGGMPGMGGPVIIPTYVEKASGQKSGQFTCTLYDEMKGQERAAEICSAPMSQVHLTASDIKTFEKLAKMMEPLVKMNPMAASFTAPTQEKIHGYPVHTVTYVNGKASHETKLVSVEQQSVDANLFVVPAGLTKTDMGSMMGGRGGRGPRQ